MITWTMEDSAELTATLIVVDGCRMNGNALAEDELRAAVIMAHRMKIRRSVIADRIGWNKNRLWKWAHDHGCALPEDEFPDEPLAWLTKRFNAERPAGGSNRPRIRRG